MTLPIIRKLNLLEENLVQSQFLFFFLQIQVSFSATTEVPPKEPQNLRFKHSRNYTELWTTTLSYLVFAICLSRSVRARTHLFHTGHPPSFPSSLRLPNLMSYEEEFILKIF